jgi:hypothetical protein
LSFKNHPTQVRAIARPLTSKRPQQF